MTIVHKFADGVSIVKQVASAVVTSGNDKSVSVTVYDAGEILALLDVQFACAPDTQLQVPYDFSWTNNALTFKVSNVAASTTLTTTVYALVK